MYPLCTLGPSLLTSTAREVILRDSKVKYKLAATDFKDYGGRFKAVSTPVKNDPKHYMNAMQNKNMRLLREYKEEPPINREILDRWQDMAIQGQNGKEIFVVDKGFKRGIPNFDTFLALNFTMADVVVISDSRIEKIPRGDSMPPLDYTGPYPTHG